MDAVGEREPENVSVRGPLRVAKLVRRVDGCVGDDLGAGAVGAHRDEPLDVWIGRHVDDARSVRRPVRSPAELRASVE